MPKLLVTVFHGKVVEVSGGAEETSDQPWQLPSAAPGTSDSESKPFAHSWGEWLIAWFFSK